ncbi:predicted protein [Plenodomus lingam JN3]|uniref:Predicted protein n=1 Tax=Leptosphaeria maculans (strain JN3 / isolate v23.1.3 / race Av1-4-5-6-7-8) TaxID=985895 RepID=E4ZZR0_LEPMJ|nr:predicted protein [Plenodomus lingam JN3]CBX97176.1 predicted protein [Plenodomus lingam JN3]
MHMPMHRKIHMVCRVPSRRRERVWVSNTPYILDSQDMATPLNAMQENTITSGMMKIHACAWAQEKTFHPHLS